MEGKLPSLPSYRQRHNFLPILSRYHVLSPLCTLMINLYIFLSKHDYSGAEALEYFKGDPALFNVVRNVLARALCSISWDDLFDSSP